ncbi:unnamed protein product, partial [Ectocarpus sp. 12 AP-2014]
MNGQIIGVGGMFRACMRTYLHIGDVVFLHCDDFVSRRMYLV